MLTDRVKNVTDKATMFARGRRADRDLAGHQREGAARRGSYARARRERTVGDLSDSWAQRAAQDRLRVSRARVDVRRDRSPDRSPRRGRWREGNRARRQSARDPEKQPRSVRRELGDVSHRRRRGERLVALDPARARVPAAALWGEGRVLRGRAQRVDGGALRARRAAEGASVLGQRRGRRLRVARLDPARAPRDRRRRARRHGDHLHLGNHRKAQGRRAQVRHGADRGVLLVHPRDADARERPAPGRVSDVSLDGPRLRGDGADAGRDVRDRARFRAREVSLDHRARANHHSGDRPPRCCTG
jgi:hypothetical protein